jgi:hypothetical protein
VSTVRKIRKKPVVVEAMQWTGDNASDLVLWSNHNFDEVYPQDRSDDPDFTGEVFDKLHSSFVGVYEGQWVIRGVQGEYYPCDDDVLRSTYDFVEEEPNDADE